MSATFVVVRCFISDTRIHYSPFIPKLIEKKGLKDFPFPIFSRVFFRRKKGIVMEFF